MPSPTVQEILRYGFAEFRRDHPLPGYVVHAAEQIMRCRTEAMGGHVESCPQGHVHRVWYNSCKHRVCPQCAGLQVQQWLDKQKARLLACDHYHVIFTVPDELTAVWRCNRRAFARVLFHSVRDALVMLLGDPKYLGATPGLVLAMHTWGRSLIEHPHIHCLVTGGGLTEAGQWKRVAKQCLLPRIVLMMIFRGKLLDALRQAADAGKLVLPKGMRLNQLKGLLNKLGRVDWNVKIMERYASGSGVLTYLACYLRGGPISNRRLLSFADGQVRFRYGDHRDLDAEGRPRQTTLSLPVAEFLRRLLSHVPVPGVQMVRSYGLYANTKGEALAQARQQLGQPELVKGKPLSWQDFCERWEDQTGLCCPVCGSRLVRHGVFRRGQPAPLPAVQGVPP